MLPTGEVFKQETGGHFTDRPQQARELSKTAVGLTGQGGLHIPAGLRKKGMKEILCLRENMTSNTGALGLAVMGRVYLRREPEPGKDS